jgi:hypothetical protein
MSRVINYLRTHGSLYIPKVGETGNVLPRQNKKDTLSMVACVEGAHVRLNSVEFIIPWGNIQLAVLEPEAAAQKPAEEKPVAKAAPAVKVKPAAA